MNLTDASFVSTKRPVLSYNIRRNRRNTTIHTSASEHTNIRDSTPRRMMFILNVSSKLFSYYYVIFRNKIHNLHSASCHHAVQIQILHVFIILYTALIHRNGIEVETKNTRNIMNQAHFCHNYNKNDIKCNFILFCNENIVNNSFHSIERHFRSWFSRWGSIVVVYLLYCRKRTLTGKASGALCALAITLYIIMHQYHVYIIYTYESSI